MAIPFERNFDAPYGEIVALSPRIGRVLAKNPGPFTFKGTGVYILGDNDVAVIDPGPDLPVHVEALKHAIGDRRLTHILATHTHSDHSPAARPLKEWSGAKTYAFGPHTAYQPPMFKIGANMFYYARPAAGNCSNPAIAQPACNSNGINGYVGSGATFPWSVTFFPFSDFKPTQIRPGTIPFIGYEDANVWFHAENTPETFNQVVAGLVQILPHGLSLSYTYVKLNGRPSSDTIPPPDTIRSAVSILKLTYDLHF